MAGMGVFEGRKAPDCGIIQRSTGCCRGQISGKGHWCSSTSEPAKAGSAQIRYRCVPPARMPRCSYRSCAHCRCSILMVLDRNTLSGRCIDTLMRVRPERDLPGLALDHQRHERAAERAPAGDISLRVAIHVEWRAACPLPGRLSRLMPGQPLPTGVAAVCIAVPVEQPDACEASGTGERVPTA